MPESRRTIRVVDVLQNPSLFLNAEFTLEDLMIAQGNDRFAEDLAWMLSESWLDSSATPDIAVLDRSHSIQLCLPKLSYAFFWTVTPCGGWPIDAYSVAKVTGTLISGTNGFAFNIVDIKHVIVGSEDIICKIAGI
jgi:hypothetical protein